MRSSGAHIYPWLHKCSQCMLCSHAPCMVMTPKSQLRYVVKVFKPVHPASTEAPEDFSHIPPSVECAELRLQGQDRAVIEQWSIQDSWCNGLQGAEEHKVQVRRWLSKDWQ